MKNKEIWQDIPGYEGYYQASTHGRIRNVDRIFIRNNGRQYTTKSRVMRLDTDTVWKYIRITLKKNMIKKRYLVHRLVANTFIPNTCNKLEINHKDGDKSNNYVSNLEWSSRSENMQHSALNGLMSGVKLTRGDVEQIKIMLKSGKKRDDIARLFNVTGTCITYIKQGRSWGWL